MINNINNFGTINFYENNSNKSHAEKQTVEDITPIPVGENTSESIIFTKKAKKEGKIPSIIQALQHSMEGRTDKTRALVQELQSWQEDGYVDAYYNARVMYDELLKIMPLPFGYDAFKRNYNNSRP